ncbi:transketolase [candidate division KSB1 bacterium]|nr:transketolase [candidate division KSB1 bacterium]
MSTKTISPELAKKAANTIRLLAADGVQKANSGHPGMPMGMADCAFVLWTQFLKYNPNDPDWLGRDRFVLSAGHGSMLIYSMLHLSGYDFSIDDLKLFRQWKSKTPGHPEKDLPGVETTTGPLGQGFSNGIGMAIAEKMMAARFGDDLFNGHVFAIAGDGDMMEGVTSEAASIAGHLKLGNLVYFYDDNSITIEGSTSLAFSEDVGKRFEAYGWHVLKINAHDHEQIAKALQAGIAETSKPTLIIAKSKIGYGSPNKEGSAESHGAPLGQDEVKATKKNLGFPEDKDFYVPDDVREVFAQRAADLKSVYNEWTKKFEAWKKANPEKAALLNAMLNWDAPASLETELLKAVPEKDVATRASSGTIIQKMAELVPCMVGGSADLDPSCKTFIKASGSIAAGAFDQRNFHFGIREHAMGSIMNGICLHGGFRPFGSTFLVFADYMRPSIRLASLMKLPIVYVFTHDSIFVGEDGPTHQPIEQVASLRLIPGLTVIRPADSYEVALAWAYAVKHKNGPTALILTRQNVPNLKRAEAGDVSMLSRGAYIISPEKGVKPDVVLLASGSEVHISLDAQKQLEAEGKSVRVVSIPSVEIFKAQPAAYREDILPAGVPVVVVEAGTSFGWGDICDSKVTVLGIDQFGSSGPWKELAVKFGFTGNQVAERVRDLLK